MLRFLLIVSLIVYVLYKFGFFRGLAQGMQGDPQGSTRRSPNSNLNVDSVPPKEKKRNDIKGGEYIDYEEVK
jgi:hypothetical protein